MRRYFLIITPYFWLISLFVIPFLIVIRISLSDPEISIPPYTPILSLEEGWSGLLQFLRQLDLDNYIFLTQDALYWKAYLSSLRIAAFSTIIALFVGFPIAYGMAKVQRKWQTTLLILIILPFWTSFLIRVYSWIGILSTEGYLNQVLLGLGIINQPLTLLNTPFAVYVGITYTYLPFMVLPIYASLEKLDYSLLEAAEDLGCSQISAFWLITVPLCRAGILAGCFLVFIPTLGEIIIPSLLGGSNTLMIGKVLWEEFFNNRDWPVASAVAVILLIILIIPIVLFQRNEQKQQDLGTR
ncbi:MAG: ABC transporter permease subunit [Aestuariivita sp.]|nr:ABC transporter permease subunit [Aestuariivita sp.]